MRAITQLAGALLACTVVLPRAAPAAEASPGPVSIASAAQDSSTFSADQDATPGIGAALDAGRLDAYRGGSDSITEVLNKAQLNGTVGSNVAAYVATGSNAITDGAFANASGMPTVIQNSGANVLIQNSLIVNLQLK